MTPPRGPRILLAEDEALIALDLQDILEGAGYTVVGPADRVSSALVLASSEQFEAAALDVDLAGEKIWPVAEALLMRGIPIVFLSGFSARLDPQPVQAKVLYIDKPIDPSMLLEALESVIQAPAQRK
ncbi:MAG: response regulator [Beijerinckiaceae bacterium]|nr:response regulator [Beijerinckiaceae bacterium]